MSTAPPAEIKGKFFAIGTVVAQPGKTDEVQQTLETIRAIALSDEEPETLKYQPLRGVGSENDKFTVVEEYASAAGLEKHCQHEVFQKFLQSGIFKIVDFIFCEEFS